jgi:TonB family protein
MIMMTKTKFRTGSFLGLLIVIPLSAALIIWTTSCAGTKKASTTQKEIAPSPPPPPPPPPLPDDIRKQDVRQETPSEVFVIVEQMPQYPGGDEALMKFINSNVVYPKTAKDKGIQGRVIVRFVVDAEGIVKNPDIIRSANPELDAEALRVIGLLPKWTPGLQGGKKVNVYYTLPITFTLGPSNPMTRYFVAGKDTIYLITEERAMFPGGNDSLNKFRSNNLKYPLAALSNKFGGSEGVSFIVNENGSLSDFSISGGICPSLDAEVLRVAKLMPMWQPGMEKGKPVKSRNYVSFNFNLPSDRKSPEAPSEIFVVVEEMPVFPGGDSALMNFIGRNIQYPKNAKEKNIQGRVILRFCVTYEGKIGRVGILKSIDPELDMEALRVIKMLPQWKPGKQGGKPVNVWYSVPVTFKLDGTPPADAAVKPPARSVSAGTIPTFMGGYDEPPVFKGGESALMNFINTSIVYPKAAKEKGIAGTVVINYCITETGTIENVLLRESADPLLDAEALRVMRLLPAWQPGKLKGVPVKVFYNIPITFSIK